MREIRQTSQFRTDLKRIAKSGRYRKEDLMDLLELLSEDEPIPIKYRDHALSGEWNQFRECHIKPDWLLIYRLEPGVLLLARTGSHSDLF